jgi:hypothetical protein
MIEYNARIEVVVSASSEKDARDMLKKLLRDVRMVELKVEEEDPKKIGVYVWDEKKGLILT